MKKKILKYSINGTDSPDINLHGPGHPFTIEMASGAEILSVQAQPDKLENSYCGRMWVLVDADETKKIKRQFVLLETGAEFEFLPDRMKYISTYQLFLGEYVLHLFEFTPMLMH